jgi:hypothetical protein
MGTVARFHPTTFNCKNLEILANTFEEIFYIDNDQYKRVEMIEDSNVGIKPTKCYLNDEEIAEWIYEESLTENVHTINRNHIVFLENGKVCDFFFYHMHDGTLKCIVEVEFFSQAERENFIRPFWFGKEVNSNFFNDYAIWNAVII